MAMKKFVHLRVHSHYSLLEALPKIDELVKKAKKDGMEALALTDMGNLYGAIEFYKECLDEGIKPIIGVDFATEHGRLILLAENNKGYHNLLKLVTASNLENPNQKPVVRREHLERHHEGLIAIAREEKIYKDLFGDRFYRENELALYDVRYLEEEDRPVLNTLLSIQGHAAPGGLDEEEDFHFRTTKEAKEDYKENPKALEKMREIAERCNVSLTLGKWIFPPLQLPEGTTAEAELLRLANEGIKERGLTETPELRERLKYEYKVITDKGFAPYFLVVADLLRFASDHGILSTTRGSAGGSLISYLIGITTINPLTYNLPFERFLNPERPKAPDIDMDFADNRRDEITEYAKHKYGADHVAQIGTFGTMMARGSVRDVARALGFSYNLGDQIAKLIPMGIQGFPMTLDRALKETPELKEMYESDQDTKTIIDTAKKIEGNARHISVHAAGMVISPKPLVEYTPLQFDTKGEGKIITGYDMYSLTDEYGGVGLLKFDILGIRNLSIIADALERIKKIEGKEIHVADIPVDDKKTYAMLAKGETEATFQLNGSGMTRFLMDLKPTTIHDINAMVALYRPGPMETIPQYIERKHNPKLISYMHPKMKEYLEFSNGILVYQDDVLLTAIKIAGYTWLEADALRKAMGKKIPEEMEKQHKKFLEGAEKNGTSKSLADKLWDLIKPFAAYGFGKAHAASYGLVAYQTAWLKANYPEIYMSSVLTAESGDVATIGVMVNECKRMGIEVLSPSINESFSQFSVIPNSAEASLGKPAHKYKIRFGLTTIKNFGAGISSSITQERKANGKFKSLEDFLDRVKDKNLNKKSLESLIMAGAMDEFGERGLLLTNLEALLSYHKERMATPDAQHSLFGLMTDTATLPKLRLTPALEVSLQTKLGWEKELLGLYISGHPLEQYREKFAAKELNIKKLNDFREGTEAVIGGVVEEAKEIMTKGNEKMVFMKLTDFSGTIEVAIFPRVLDGFKDFVKPDACIAIKGKVSKRKGETSFIAEKIKAL